MHRRGRHLPYALQLVGFIFTKGGCGNLRRHGAPSASALSLVQEEAQLHTRRAPPGREAPHRDPFSHAIVVSVNPEAYESAREHLETQGVNVEPFWGFDGSNASELAASLEVLRGYNNTVTLHKTLGNFVACMHTSPGTPPHIRWAVIEKIRSLMHHSVRSVDDLLRHDHHRCVPKMVAIAASQVHLWEGLVSGQLPARGRLAVAGQKVSTDLASVAEGSGSDASDPWYLVMEDDARLCPGWRERMKAELPRLPADADIVKLFFFGHWRKTDQLPDAEDGTPSPFLEAQDPMSTWDIAKASAYEILHGNGFARVPVAGFYAGTQAYLIKRSSARRLLDKIRGMAFQDVDMTMMMSTVKHYVWRMPLATGNSMTKQSSDPEHSSLLQVKLVPVCNREPPKDWFFQR